MAIQVSNGTWRIDTRGQGGPRMTISQSSGNGFTYQFAGNPMQRQAVEGPNNSISLTLPSGAVLSGFVNSGQSMSSNPSLPTGDPPTWTADWESSEEVEAFVSGEVY